MRSTSLQKKQQSKHVKLPKIIGKMIFSNSNKMIIKYKRLIMIIIKLLKNGGTKRIDNFNKTK